jgi:hypothetical protein
MQDVKINNMDMTEQEAKKYLSSLVEKFELASVRICDSSIHIKTVDAWDIFVICNSESIGNNIICHFLMAWHEKLK